MKEIKLTQGKVALVDDKDYDFLNQWKWHALQSKNSFYAYRSQRYGRIKRGIAMHRVIMNISDPHTLCDHKDRDGLNNQRSNLRLATKSQNAMNKKSIGACKYLGVCWNKQPRKWIAQIKSGNIKRLGAYNSAEEAARAYDEAAKKYHGEFANLNFK